jgi:enoyl-CoA hydratase/carnithine racemase
LGEQVDQVLTTRSGGVEQVTLNRPRYRNAVDVATLRRLEDVADRWRLDPPRVVVLRATAPGFCSGVDLKESKGASPRFARDRSAIMHRVLGKLRRTPVPIVAAIDGPALGLGCELAISADIRLGTPDSTFGYPEPRVAVPSPTHHLAWLVGLARAQDMLLTARTIHAAEAAAIGVLTRVEEDVERAALDVAEQIGQLAPYSIAKTKENLTIAIAAGALEASSHHIEAIHDAAATEDRAEALQAFADKRPPVFTGR